MLGWLKSLKPQPAETGSAEPGKTNGFPPKAKSPAGAAALDIDADALRPHPLLALLPRTTLARLLAGPELSEYPKGTVIYREGDPSDDIFLIVSGRCESQRQTRDGAMVEEVFNPGDTLGERAFLNREPHRSTVVVVTHCVLLRIPGAELQGLFAKDPKLAGRFTHTVTARPGPVSRRVTGRATRVRRVVSFMPIARRVDAEAMMRSLATSLHRVSGQRVLLVHLGSSEEPDTVRDWVQTTANFNGEVFFTRELQRKDAWDSLRLAVGSEPRDTAAMARLLSHCGRHYDFVLLDLAREVPAPAALACTIESDLAFVLMDSSTQNLYDFQLLMRQLGEQARGSCGHVKPMLFVEDSVAPPEAHIALKQLGHPVHSIVRGFPVVDAPTYPDQRFGLHTRRLAREIARCRVGLALSSGGAKGLAHIGVIQVLEENGIEVDCITGTSMGAYVGAIWACGLDGTQLEKIARAHEGRWGLFSLIDPSFPPRRGFFRTRRTIGRLRRSIGATHFSETVRPLRVLATHLATLERVVFSTGEIATAVEASIAIPGVIVPVTIDGETYVDGGIADPLPVDVLQESGIERIIAVNVIPPPERIRQWYDARREKEANKPRPRSWTSVLNQHVNYLASGNVIDIMMKAVSGAQTRVAEAASREADVLLRPITGDATWHDFTHPQKYIELGRRSAEACIREIKALAQPSSHDPTSSPRPVADRAASAA
jgi:NTE family protein